MPGDEQDHGERDQLLPADRSVRVVAVDQLVEEPLPRFRTLAVDQRAQVLLQFVAGPVDVGGAGAAQEPLRALLEELMVGVRHAQQRADHHRRHRQGVRAHQLGGRTLPFHRVEQPVHGLLDAGAQRADPLHGEARDEHPALDVVLGIVDAEESDAALLHIREPRGRDGEVGVGAVGGQPGIGQQPHGPGHAR